MFTQISWSSYITTMALILACYYLFVGFTFYGNDLLELFSMRKATRFGEANLMTTKTTSPSKLPHEVYMQESVEEQNLYQLLQALSDEIQAYLVEAGKNQLTKDEVSKSLKTLLTKYGVFKESSFRNSIQHLMINECERYCSIRLREDEVSALWM